MKNKQQRINIIIGQLKGVAKMFDNKDDCQDVLVQLKAIKSALNSLVNKYIKENALFCLDDKVAPKDKKRIKDLFEEIINNN